MSKRFPVPATDETRADRKAALEAGAGVDPIETLQARRRELVEQCAPLSAFSKVWDARRKSFRATIMRDLDAQHLKKKGKHAPVTALENWASSDHRYVEWLDRAEGEFARLLILEDQIQALTERINRGQALLRAYANEPK